ncbi:hypothetical protein VTN00DRAFT_8127 [Thermoascus crustaceus]|uniref:uncharacterized protein n=1 Tax=Thermoascus crustaceus TaxID=5088 RepID=UPI003742BCD1
MSVKRFLKRFRHRLVPCSSPSLPQGKKEKKEKNHDEDEEDLDIDTNYDDDNDDDESSEMGIDRVISWASILTGTSRWSVEQDLEELEEEEVPWSSHREHELEQIKTLTEEKKEAHEVFVQMRTRQQDEERHRFRKARGRGWKRYSTNVLRGY